MSAKATRVSDIREWGAAETFGHALHSASSPVKGLIAEWKSADASVVALERAYVAALERVRPAIYDAIIEARKARDVIFHAIKQERSS